jgi:hypothetical protein
MTAFLISGGDGDQGAFRKPADALGALPLEAEPGADQNARASILKS